MTSTKTQRKRLDPGIQPKELKTFVSSAAHDLHEPLRAVRTHAQLLANCHEGTEADQREEYLRHLHDGVDRMENLIRNLEEFCFEELRELEASETSMELALREGRRQVSPQLESCGAQLTHDPLPTITGDPMALASLFRILLENACKFRSTAPLMIHVGAVREGREWSFSVRDNGKGFSMNYADLIFKPFERLYGKKYPGSGLGLSLARRIVQRHGGRIWAESTPEVGSTFRFVLKQALK